MQLKRDEEIKEQSHRELSIERVVITVGWPAIADIRNRRLQSALVFLLLAGAAGVLARTVTVQRGVSDASDRTFEEGRGRHGVSLESDGGRWDRDLREPTVAWRLEAICCDGLALPSWFTARLQFSDPIGRLATSTQAAEASFFKYS